MASALLQALKQRFPDLSSLSAVTLSLQSIRKANVPLVSFQSHISTGSLALLVETSCPTDNPKTQEKLVQAAKRIRKFSNIAEESACSKCALKGNCPFLDKQAAGPPANVLDLTKVLYGLSQLKSLPEQQEKAAVEVMQGLDTALSKSLQTPQSSYRVLKNVRIPQVIEAIGTPKHPSKPRAPIPDKLKWQPDEHHLKRQEQVWSRRESRSTLNLIMNSIRQAVRLDGDKKSGARTSKSPRKAKPHT
jgi:hypothetical protein